MLIAGILMLTVILTPLAVLLLPVTSIVLAMIFLRDPGDVDFV